MLKLGKSGEGVLWESIVLFTCNFSAGQRLFQNKKFWFLKVNK